MTLDEAEAAFQALKLMVRNLERDIEPDEAIYISSMGLDPIEFMLHQIVQHGPLIIVLGHTDDGQAQELVFAPAQISFRAFSRKIDEGRRAIGFHRED